MKLTAQELRIGNYVQFANYEPHQLEREEFSYTENFANIEDYKPIPLTEQWLIDFGFKTTPLGFKKTIGNKRELSLSLCNDKGMGEYYFYVRDNEDFTGFSIRIFTVHQLQNLYFALTGKELTLNK